MSQWKSFLVVALFLVGSGLSGEVDAEESRTYPNDWTHRPIMEYFTGLSCPPCMSIQPDVSTLWQEFREDP
ncbi:MAG: hypothetical protein QF482_05720, partial [Candidatus Poseidoniia archaeon]|nr:hypothetical protein [Candidatus Poseidoniia archaeon]